MRFDVLTLFPAVFDSPLSFSVLKRAIDNGLIEIKIHDIRNFARDRHRITDDYPYGGGEGMVMKVEPIVFALEHIQSEGPKGKAILLSPQGELLDQRRAQYLTQQKRIILICGRYEGIDERVRLYWVDEEISIGDYILSGGELAAMVVIDVVARLLEGVVGNVFSVKKETFQNELLKYPQYTRPRVFRGKEIPKVLISGNHAEIEMWRREEALKRTFTRRPELLSRANLTKEDKRILEEIRKEP